ncbi:UDP-N-acetylmuramate dehydrogenase [Candidatus Saccharibacteria bacterium]|nr:UDP-N-acetylmuramate dehydrogenase [Candidatus Saccharibacteria bacterium]
MKPQLQEHVDLAQLTTFKMGGTARYFIEVTQAEELKDIFAWIKSEGLPYFILSGGSNTIFDDGEFDGVVIRINIEGFKVAEQDQQSCTVQVGAGEVWDGVVAKSVEMGLSGIEALSGIPGLAGTAPVQNIGAYGQEISDCLEYLLAFDTQTMQIEQISHYSCKFGYRDSIFKSSAKGRYIITSIVLKLSKQFGTITHYKDVVEYFSNHSDLQKSPATVRAAVLEIRKSKFANPADKPNAGSFFKNPIVSSQTYQAVAMLNPNMPHYPQKDGREKLSAGWLIENCDLKGYKSGRVQVDPKHALVLENTGGAKTEELKKLRDYIIQKVHERFGITLEPEPEIVNF